MEKMSVDLYKLMDLIEEIKKVDEIIKLHSEYQDEDFMLSQYQAKKEKLIAILIDELVSPSFRSEESFSTIKLILNKFYPNTPQKALKSSNAKIDLSLLDAYLT